MNLKAREVLSRRALVLKQNEVRKQEKRDRERLVRKSRNVEKELEAAKNTVAGLTETVHMNWKSHGTKRRTSDRETRSGSGKNPRLNGSSEMRKSAYKKGK